jgi:hypothetical protein
MKTFYEKQKFNQWWIWLIIIAITVASSYAAIQQLVFKVPFGNEPASDNVLIILCMVPLFILTIFTFMYLETKINSDGVFYKFNILHFKYRQIKWEEIEKIYTREYRPVAEYGGWGIKWGRKSGKAYNISGNQGVQIELKNGKKILIGTQKSQEVELLLQELNKK